MSSHILLLAATLLLAAAAPGTFARPVRGSQPISVLLCTTSDAGAVPAPFNLPSFYEGIIAELQNYWKTASYNLFNNRGSVVRPWTAMPLTQAQEICPPRCVSSSQCDSSCTISTAWPNCHSCQRWARAEDCINAHKSSGYTVPAGHLTLVVTYPALDYWGSGGWGAYLTFDGLSITGLAHELGHGIGLQHSYSNDPGYKNADWAGVGEYDDMWDIMSSFHVYTTTTTIQGRQVQAGPSLVAYQMERMGWLPWPYIYTMGATGETSASVVLRALNTFKPPEPTMMLPMPGTKSGLRPASVSGDATAASAGEEQGDLGAFASSLWPAQPVNEKIKPTTCYHSLLDDSITYCGEITEPHTAQESKKGGRRKGQPMRGSSLGGSGDEQAGSSASDEPIVQAAAPAPALPKPSDYHLMVRVPINASDFNHYLTVEYKRKAGLDAGIPSDRQILIHEVKALTPGVYRPFLLRDLAKSGKPPATSWSFASDGTTVTITTAPGVNRNNDFATVNIKSTFCKRCKAGLVWREACADDYTCVPAAERTANANANANPRYDSQRGGCSPGFFPRMACGMQDGAVCVDKAAKYQIALANNAAAGRVDNLAASTYGPNTCKPGLVWRFGDMFDYVCVNIATRSDVAAANLERWNRFDPAATDAWPYGVFTCKAGLVWREAFAGDLTCVPVAARSQAADDNKNAQERLLNVNA